MSTSDLTRWEPSVPPPPKRIRLDFQEPPVAAYAKEEDDDSSDEEDSTTGNNDDPPSLPSVPQPSLTNSEDFYFKDGNLIIQVAGTRAFKVHQSLFAKSSVFAGMLEVGTGNDGAVAKGDKLGDVVVEIKEDDVHAWELLLKVVYDGIAFSTFAPSLNKLRAVLLLSDKYEHLSIHQIVKAQFIALVSPQLLQDFKDGSAQDDSFSARELRGVLDMALRFQVHQILPMVYYLLATSIDLVLDPLTLDQPSDSYGWLIEGLSRDEILRIARLSRQGLSSQEDFFDAIHEKSDGTGYHEHFCQSKSSCRSNVARMVGNNTWPTKLTYHALLQKHLKKDAEAWGMQPKCFESLSEELNSDLESFNQIIIDTIGGVDGYFKTA